MDPKAARRVLARIFGVTERELKARDGELVAPEPRRVHEVLGARNARLPLELYRAALGTEWDPRDDIAAMGFVRALARLVKPRHVLVTGRLIPLEVVELPLPRRLEAARRRLAYRVLCAAFKLEPEELKRLAEPLRRPPEQAAVRELLWSHLERADPRPAMALLQGSEDVERVLERVTPEVKPWHIFYKDGVGSWCLELRPLARANPVRESDVTNEAYAIAALRACTDGPLVV